MKNINAYLLENIASIGNRISATPNIDNKKLNNSIKAFGYSGSPNSIIAIFDNTLFGSGKSGIIFTGKKFIYRPGSSSPIHVDYAQMANIEHIETQAESDKDKPENSIEVTKQDGKKIEIKNLFQCDYTKFSKILQTIINDFEDYKEENKFASIGEMNEPLKVSYLKAIINMAYDNDDVIDENELAEILLLMTRLDLSIESRFSLRAYMASMDEATPLEQLLAQIDAECPDGQMARSNHCTFPLLKI